MKCMLCGTENRAEANRCKGCGASLAASTGPDLARRTPAPTILENAGTSPIAAPPVAPVQGGGRHTRLVTPEEGARVSATVSSPPAGGPRKTVYLPPEDSTASPNGHANLPKLVGFLVTFSWNAAGQSFVVREGKNTFGSEPSCDGTIAQDRVMSAKHFAIMYRAGEIRVRDLDSTNATRVDDQEIWGDSRPVHHGSIIKAGDTTFQLVLIPSQTAE